MPGRNIIYIIYIYIYHCICISIITGVASVCQCLPGHGKVTRKHGDRMDPLSRRLRGNLQSGTVVASPSSRFLFLDGFPIGTMRISLTCSAAGGMSAMLPAKHLHVTVPFVSYRGWRCLRSRYLLKSWVWVWVKISRAKKNSQFWCVNQKTTATSFPWTQVWTMLTSDQSSSLLLLNQSITKCHGMKDC